MAGVISDIDHKEDFQMAKMGKRYVESSKLIDSTKAYEPMEALKLVQETAKAKFDETVEIHIRLGVDPRHSDQQVRGAVVLPNGTGKTKTVLVFAKGDKAKEAEAAGAEFVGADELADKIKGGWFDFDVTIATPDMMGLVGKLGKVLGPKGLMPNPKYRVDKTAIIHVPIGKVSFGDQKLMENYATLVNAVIKAKPSGAKGQYIKSITVASTMGPGVKVNHQAALNVSSGN